MRIIQGDDTDGDGVLSPSEVTDIRYACNQAAPTALSRTSSEPAGANCPYGGTKIESGLDTDGDGRLSPSEVTSARYECSGAGGTCTTLLPPPC